MSINKLLLIWDTAIVDLQKSKFKANNVRLRNCSLHYNNTVNKYYIMYNNVTYDLNNIKYTEINMNKVKVIKVDSDIIEFDNGILLYSDHDQDCCENHYLSMSDLTLSDFDELEFDLSTDNFFNRIDGYGIELIPIHGHSVKIPGYGSNNGYYSSNLSLILTNNKDFCKEYDITECQDW